MKWGMVMASRGISNDRLCDLRKDMGITQKELSERVNIPTSQISRIENGEIKQISSGILIKMAKEFNVSVDYILGLTPIGTPKSYDISALGLSEKAIKPLVTGKVDTQTLNRLLEHRGFPNLIRLIKYYFDGSCAAGMRARNDVIDMATAELADFLIEHQKNAVEVKDDILGLKADKFTDREAEIEKIKNVFLSILRDIKKGMDNGESPSETITLELMQRMWAQLKDAPQEGLKPELAVDALMNAVKQTVELDDGTAELFRQMVVGIMAKQSQ